MSCLPDSLQILIKPVEGSLEHINAMSGLAETMPFTRIADQDGIDAAATQSHVHLFSLRDVHVIVLLTVNEHGRRLRLSNVPQRRPLPQQVVIVPRKAAELRMNQILIKRGRIKAD